MGMRRGGDDDTSIDRGRFQALDSMLETVARSEREVMEARQRARAAEADLRREREARAAAEMKAKEANARAAAAESQRVALTHASSSMTLPLTRPVSGRRSAAAAAAAAANTNTNMNTSDKAEDPTSTALELRRQLAGREAKAEETRAASERLRREAAQRMRRVQQLETAAAAATTTADRPGSGRRSEFSDSTGMSEAGAEDDEVGALWSALREAQTELVAARRGVVSTAIASAARCRRDIEAGQHLAAGSPGDTSSS